MPHPLHSSVFMLSALTLIQACTSNDSDAASATRVQPAEAASPTAGSGAAAEPSAADPSGCARGAIESDMGSSPLAGPAVKDGALAPGQYVISSTYLRLKPEGQARFDELLGPIMADLASRDGLVALSLGGSPQCGTARTLAVWRDDIAMFSFVTGDAHSAAVRAIGEVSRGGSVVTHWSGDQNSATWQAAAEHLAADDGPQY